MPLTIIAFLGVLFILVLAHELGHFGTAKAFGVKVEEFGIGFPPRLLSIIRGGTRYSINALPLGGFVKMAGEEDPNIPGSLASKSIFARLVVLGSGSLMNFLLPLILFSAALIIPADIVRGQVVIDAVVADSPAARAGIRQGDIVLSVNGNTVLNNGDLHRYIQLNLGQEIDMLVRHSDATEENINVTPRWQPPPGEGATGIAISTVNYSIVSQSYPVWKAVPMAVTTSIDTFILFKNGIVSMVIGTAPVAVTGPVGIAQITGEVARAGISPLLEFAAFLSINLAIINIFPLPGLDGGRIAFVLLEGIRRGKRITPKTEGLIHLIGFLILMTYILAITFQDIVRIINGDSLLP